MGAQDLDRIRALFEGWSRGDWSGGTELFADNVVVTTFDADGDEIALDGLAALQAWHRSFLQQWHDLRQDCDELLDLGDRILSIGRQTATGRASGVSVEIRIYNVFVFDDGRVVEFHVTRHEDVARRRAGLNAR